MIHQLILEQKCSNSYLNRLKKQLARYEFSKVFDLQNSNRTKFYKRFIIKNLEWSSTETSLEPGQKKSHFDQDPVLDRMEVQLRKSGIETEFVKKACILSENN